MTTLIKLGGSLVTDKRQAKSFRRTTVRNIARQLSKIRAAQPERPIVVGHGSGSFGHFEAIKHNTMHGMKSATDRLGFSRVGAVATELSLLILDELLAAGIPAMRFQPSSMLVTRSKQLTRLHTRPLIVALEKQIMPLIHGDIAIDEEIGGTIVSTETLFAQLVAPLNVQRIVLLGEVDGVLDQSGRVIATVTPVSFPRIASQLGASSGVDVTGGMLQKVTEMVKLVQAHSSLNVIVANGNRRDVLLDLLVNDAQLGTRICAEQEISRGQATR